MWVASLSKESPGTWVPTVGGVVAFVPKPLPPKLLWDDGLSGKVSAATLALGRLDGVARDLPNPHLLIRPFLRREAVLSSQIEGTQASMPDLLRFEIDKKVEQEVPDVREVSNCVRALEFGLQRRKTLPLSLRLIRNMHQILMEGVRGRNREPGEFRRSQVHIGPEGAGIEHATFVPPPPSELPRLLGELEKYLHAPSDLPPVVRLALVHYQFEAIHPFLDGNGRIGRLLISLMLCLDGILSLPLLYLSAFFQRTRPEYYQRLLDVSLKGRWTAWIGYFAQGVASEAMDAVDRTRRLKELQAGYLGKVRTARTSALVTRLIEELFRYPMVSVPKLAQLLDVTQNTAQKHVDRLIKAGILRPADDRRRNRVFVADGIIHAIYEPDDRKAPPIP